MMDGRQLAALARLMAPLCWRVDLDHEARARALRWTLSDALTLTNAMVSVLGRGAASEALLTGPIWYCQGPDEATATMIPAPDAASAAAIYGVEGADVARSR